MSSLKSKFIWLTLFSIAMGFMESAIVVYLRKIYYPTGFEFPLKPIEVSIASTEFLREIATIIMLVGIGVLVGKNKLQRFSYFIFSFAIWDLFYYVFLKLLLNWPASFFTWDILFLVPVPWVSPVLAPCIVSLTMIALTLCAVYWDDRNDIRNFTAKEWWLLTIGSLIVIISFVWDYFDYVFKHQIGKPLWQLSFADSLLSDVTNYVPNQFQWVVFLVGEIVIIVTIILFVKRAKV